MNANKFGGICMEVLKKTEKILSWDSWSRGLNRIRDLPNAKQNCWLLIRDVPFPIRDITLGQNVQRMLPEETSQGDVHSNERFISTTSEQIPMQFRIGCLRYKLLSELNSSQCWPNIIPQRVLNIETRWRSVASFTLRPLYPRGKTPR